MYSTTRTFETDAEADAFVRGFDLARRVAFTHRDTEPAVSVNVDAEEPETVLIDVDDADQAAFHAFLEWAK